MKGNSIGQLWELFTILYLSTKLGKMFAPANGSSLERVELHTSLVSNRYVKVLKIQLFLRNALTLSYVQSVADPMYRCRWRGVYDSTAVVSNVGLASSSWIHGIRKISFHISLSSGINHLNIVRFIISILWYFLYCIFFLYCELLRAEIASNVPFFGLCI